MRKSQIIKELAIFVFNNALSEDISDLVYKTLSHGIDIPKESCYLIPDKRYHKQFPVVYSFMFALSKLKEPPYDIVTALLRESANKINLPLIGTDLTMKLVLHVLIIEFFRTNPSYLKDPEPIL